MSRIVEAILGYRTCDCMYNNVQQPLVGAADVSIEHQIMGLANPTTSDRIYKLIAVGNIRDAAVFAALSNPWNQNAPNVLARVGIPISKAELEQLSSLPNNLYDPVEERNIVLSIYGKYGQYDSVILAYNEAYNAIKVNMKHINVILNSMTVSQMAAIEAASAVAQVRP